MAMALAVSGSYSIHCREIVQSVSLHRCAPFAVKNLTFSSRLCRNFGSLAISSTRSERFLPFTTLLQSRRVRGGELHSVRAGKEKKRSVGREEERDFEVSLRDDGPSQLVVSLPLGLASFETLFLVGWVSSLRGLLPFSAPLFSAGDLIVSAVVVANFAVGWYALERSRTRMEELKVKKKARGPGWVEMALSLVVSFVPFLNLFLWLQLATQQRHLPAKAKAALVANALVYEGTRLFPLALLFNGGFWAFFRVRLEIFCRMGLISIVALFLSALHRPLEGARVRNEKVLAEAARAAEKQRQKRFSEERERITRLQELEEFDWMLAHRAGSRTALLPGKVKEWTVGETMEWLGQQGLARYATTFADNHIDGEVLLQLTSDDLRDELNILSFGDRRKMQVLIQDLRERA